jgi:DNA-binding transcriptional MerR regulator
MATQLSPKRAASPPSIPDRLYFKIGDVARICELETYVLRFWETQFPQLKPNKSGTGQRLYRRRDVELALEIKRLVHAEGYTLEGARQILAPIHRRHDPQSEAQSRLPLTVADSGQRTDQIDKLAAAIGRARVELRELASLLASPQPQPVRRRPRLTSPAEDSGSLFPA